MADESKSRRPFKLTAGVREAIVEAVRRGVPLATAARAAGVSERAIHGWLRVGRGDATTWTSDSSVAEVTLQECRAFFQAVEVARAACEMEHLRRIAQASAAPDPKGRTDWRASAWLLNNSPAYRETYHEHRAMSIEGEVTLHPAVRMIRALSDEQLLQEIEGIDKLPRLAEPPA